MKKYFALLIASTLLLVAAIGWSIQKRNNFSDESIAREISINLSREISSLKEESKALSKVEWSKLNHPFYLIENGKFSQWSKTDPVINIRDCDGKFEWKLIQSSNNDLLLYKRQESDRRVSVGVIPLRVGYDLVNQYLSSSWNRKIFSFDRIKILNAQSVNGKPVCTPDGLCLFKIQTERDVFIANTISTVLVACSLLIALAFIFYWIRDFHRQKKYFYAFAGLFGSLAIIRIAMVQFSFPSRWVYSKYFDPKYFASSSFNASVGDFVLNSLIVAIACIYFFSIYARTEFIRAVPRRNRFVSRLLSIVFLSAAFFSFLFPHLFIESVFHDSTILVDITSGTNFNAIRIAALIAFIFGCLSSFLFVHSFVRIAKSLTQKRELMISLLISAIVFIGYFLFSELNYWPTLIIGFCYFTVLLFSQYYKSLARVSYQTFPYLLIAIIAYGIQGAWGVRRFSEEKKLKAMFRAANNLIGNDVLGEYLLNQANLKISNDLFLAASVESPLLSKNLARQKIRLLYLSDYFDRYETRINFYHADGSPADAESLIDFATSIEAFEAEANKTGYEWIYQIRSAKAESLKRYLSIVPLKKNNSVRGYVVLDLSLKRIVPQQVYPELLSDNRFAQSIRNKDFSYALFSGEKITDRNGSFNFDRDLDRQLLSNSDLYSSGIRTSDHWIAGAEDGSGKKIILAADSYSWFSVLANFSFLFTLGVALILVFLIFYLIKRLLSKLALNYSARIQLFVYLSFILPLLTVSIIALRMITQSNDIQTEKDIESKGASISESLSVVLERADRDSTVLISDLKARVEEIAQTTGVDANLYDKWGMLITSSQQGIFNSQLIMPLLNRDALEKIVKGNYNVLKLPSHIGLLEYSSSFFAIKSESNGNLLGVLELPFFNSATDSLKSSVLSNILVTFTIVFILFSFFASNAIGKLTSPLRFIARKLNATSLGNNQPIEWSANDEIGVMVKEYNRMLGNLEQSKTELARNEKERAWREIAKQVAHEIKNPLTPMKLTLQQMERTLLQGDLSKERTENSVQTLLAQVETLNGIAGSFSAFATMPSPVMEKVELTSVLQRTVALFENHSLGNVHFEKPAISIHVQADGQLLGRIFSNIILNGLQSNKERKVEVEVTIQADTEWSVVSFKDNGKGVGAEFQDKLFLPHFSTKETGSGLGLAIAKQGIEQMGGAIWFATSVDVGSSFFIKLKNN